MHVNGVPFLVTLSRHLHFGTIDALPKLATETILQSLRSVFAVYKQHGFTPNFIMAEGAFETLQQHLQNDGITLNTTSQAKHVGEIERYIQTIKERMRGNYMVPPFKKIPRIMLIEMAKHAVFWLNALVYPLGVSSTLSPQQIVLGEHINFNRHCRYQFGQYCQTHKEHDNGMAPQTVGAIALRPTGNCQGGYYFMSLLTGCVLNQSQATPLPMLAEVITRVHELADAQEIAPDLAFGNCDNQIIQQPYQEDEDNYSTYVEEGVGDEDDEPLHYDEIADDVIDEDEIMPQDASNDNGNNIEIDKPLLDHESDHESMNEIEVPELNMDMPDFKPANQGVEIQGVEDHHPPENQPPENQPPENQGVEDNVVIDNVTAAMDAEYGPRTSSYNPRSCRRPDYRQFGDVYLGANTVDEPIAMPQMSMKRGVELFGAKGIAAVKKEIQQLHNPGIITGVDLMPEQRRLALGYLMFLKRKRNRLVKARGCADGRKQ